MKREREPHFIQEIVMPMEQDHSKDRLRSWDPDREFGKNAVGRVRRALARGAKNALSHYDTKYATQAVMGHRVLAGTTLFAPGTEEYEHLFADMGEVIESRLASKDDLTAAFYAAALYSMKGIIANSPEEQQRMSKAVETAFRNELADNRNTVASYYATLFRILTGANIGNSEQQNLIRAASEKEAKINLMKKDDLGNTIAGWQLMALRILRAHDIKFIPGKGIEIIDEGPKGLEKKFEKEAEKPPEERKF